MQNIVNQNIRTLTIFLQSTTSYLFRFGNYRGNGLVTEILLYFTISCFLTKQQIRVIRLIIIDVQTNIWIRTTKIDNLFCPSSINII
jgi:hypothetical protein